MPYKITLDFEKDFVDILLSELGDNNIQVDISEAKEKIKIKYFNFKKRLVRPAPRKVHQSKTFACPPDLTAGLSLLVQKIEAGENLIPYLSRQLANLDFNDSLLNDWGIYHLHLGTELETDGFIKRTGPVLFCRFDQSNAYLIAILTHGSWTKQEMITVLHENWPKSIEMFRMQGMIGLVEEITDEHVKLARKFGFNTAIEVEPGVVYAPIGGGITTAKTSIEVMRVVHKYDRLIENMENHFKDNAEKFGALLTEKYKYENDSLHFKLQVFGDFFCVFELNSRVCFLFDTNK